MSPDDNTQSSRGVESLEAPETPERITTACACPDADDPADSEHTSRETKRVVHEGGELKLVLHLVCSCGFEEERTIG